MRRPPQTRAAVLGVLSMRPMTGYEVRGTITDVLGHFWQESYGQIYPTLQALEADGAIRRGAPGQTSGTRFEITDTGLDELRERLADDWAPQPMRNGLLLRLFFGTQLEPGRPEALLQDVIARCDDALDEYARMRAEGDDGSDAERFRLVTLSYGEHIARAQKAWAEEALNGDKGQPNS